MDMRLTFWQALQAAWGATIPPQAAEFLRLESFETEFTDEIDPDNRRDTIDRALKALQHLYGAGLVASREPIQSSQPPNDERWVLFADLDAAWRERTGRPSGSAWRPVRVEGVRSGPMQEPEAAEVVLAFDARLSEAALTDQIRELFPALRKQGIVRRTRALKPKSIALVRHVCLGDAAGTTWQDRMDTWNAEHPDWAYAELRRFFRDFHRTEESLTGRKRGLAWFYDSAFRLNPEDLVAAAAAGDKAAKRRIGDIERGARGAGSMEEILKPLAPHLKSHIDQIFSGFRVRVDRRYGSGIGAARLRDWFFPLVAAPAREVDQLDGAERVQFAELRGLLLETLREHGIVLPAEEGGSNDEETR